FTFQMVGDLTIRGTTRETTFDVALTPTADNQLQGNASTTIRYADFGVSIPKVPAVAGVADEVGLRLYFVAKTASPNPPDLTGLGRGRGGAGKTSQSLLRLRDPQSRQPEDVLGQALGLGI